jgi:inhibitor of KinA
MQAGGLFLEKDLYCPPIHNTMEPGQQNIHIYPFGDSAIVVEFGKIISGEILNKVRAFSKLLELHDFPEMIEIVPAYSTVTVYYDPCKVSRKDYPNSYTKVERQLRILLFEMKSLPENSSEIIKIPVCYGGEYGPDLEYVAEMNGISPQDVINFHIEPKYLVYMIGFAPGFPYLGGMSEKIATPRKAVPRASIPEGSVGIAGKQTGIYPISTPGGWQLIGQTPFRLFDFGRNPASLLKAGDKVKFVQIDATEFKERRRKDAN